MMSSDTWKIYKQTVNFRLVYEYHKPLTILDDRILEVCYQAKYRELDAMQAVLTHRNTRRDVL